MVFVLLVQHGQAKSKEEDPERHLTEKGKKESEKVASLLSGKMKEKLQVIYHSGKTRAKETAEIFAEYLKPENGIVEDGTLAPLEDPEIWVKKLRDLDHNIAIIGHLPHLSRLVSKLLVGEPDREIVEFRYSGALCLERVEDKWLLRFYIVPDLI